MLAWLRRLFGHDEAPTLMDEMRGLWRPTGMPARVIYAKSDGRERMENPRLRVAPRIKRVA